MAPPPMIDFEKLDLRAAFDLAIMIEEDAQMRYEELARTFADDDGGAARVFRDMAVNEAKHRRELDSRRRVLFRRDPRIEISVLDAAGVEEPYVGDRSPPLTAREALEIALAAEVSAYHFYAGALPRIADEEVRAFFRDLMEEEQQHQALLRERLAALGSAPDARAV